MCCSWTTNPGHTPVQAVALGTAQGQSDREVSAMARRHGRHPSLVRIALLLLAGLTAAVVVSTLHSAAADPEDAEIRVSVHYPTEEESQWLDRWAEKYRAKQPGSDFSVEPATDEESAYLNRIFSDGKNGGRARAGFDGRIEFDANDRPRIVVDHNYSERPSSEPDSSADDLQNKEESYAEHDAMEL